MCSPAILLLTYLLLLGPLPAPCHHDGRSNSIDFSNEWVVHLEDGSEADSADLIALKYGYESLGEVQIAYLALEVVRQLELFPDPRVPRALRDAEGGPPGGERPGVRRPHQKPPGRGQGEML
jgi:hypothetical protein